ncbi:MAG: hypothetical protein KIT73_02495 [Burkholderiales bacterium]|nr:hypothetical protein [Burkholderiales bacterium]
MTKDHGITTANQVAIWGGTLLAMTSIDWGQVAGFLASVYSVMLISGWLYRRIRNWRRARAGLPTKPDATSY